MRIIRQQKVLKKLNFLTRIRANCTILARSPVRARLNKHTTVMSSKRGEMVPMKYYRPFGGGVIMLLLPGFFLNQDIHAYIDPGTGSIIFQVLISLFVGGLFAVKIFWNKIKDFSKNSIFKRSKRDDAKK